MSAEEPPVTMYAAERRAALLAAVRREGRVSVADASVEFGVNPETIRRDLVSLDRRGLVRKVHGGAIAVDPDEDAPRRRPPQVVTFTANPSLDLTWTLPSALAPGAVQQVTSTSTQPGGKGVNVAQVMRWAGLDVVAVFPASPADPYVDLLTATGTPFHAVPASSPVRSNLTLTDPFGQTTKINQLGGELSPVDVDAITDAVLRQADGAAWAVLSGSLPPGAPSTWYATLSGELRRRRVRVAVDTSGANFDAVLAADQDALPSLISPNLAELAQACGTDVDAWESAVTRGNVDDVRAAAAHLVASGVAQVLVTLGAAGALLVRADATWWARTPDVDVVSTVGAGDSALGGFIAARQKGHAPDVALRHAVAYGAAAVGLPGSTLPHPTQVDVDAASVTRL